MTSLSLDLFLEYFHFTSRYHRRRKYIDQDYRKHFESQITWWFVWNKGIGNLQRGKYLKFLDFRPVPCGDEASSMVSLSSLCVRAREMLAGCWLRTWKPQDLQNHVVHGEEDLFFSWLLIGDRKNFSRWLFSLSKMIPRSTKILMKPTIIHISCIPWLSSQEVYLPPDQQHSPGWGVCEPCHCQPLVLTSKSAVYTCIKPTKTETSLPWHIML